ncbi:MAG: 50S ribosomal protein L29 [Nitrososphaerota archaeon]|jgi:ribosomal protein L29|nr:50S ribosomal protein L29 [Nitrososphaerota archaeon]
MVILRLQEIINMSSADRTKKLSELRTELARMKTMINAGGAVENSTRVRELRKIIAQILTIENEVKLNLRATAKEEKAVDKKPKVNLSKEKQN